MSSALGRAFRNSSLLTGNAVFSTALNFFTIVAFTAILTRENFGAYVSSQAKVGLWLVLVDLGLYSGLISTLTFLKAKGDEALARRVLLGAMIFRLGGAIAGMALIAWLSAIDNGSGTPEFWRDLAFSPYLAGYAIQQTLNPYLAFRDAQGKCVTAHIVGLVISAFLAVASAILSGSVGLILFVLSLSPWISSIILFFSLPAYGLYQQGPNRKESPWRVLFENSWPYAILFACTTIWQRLDQVMAAELFGLEGAAEYGLAARLVGIPILMTSSISLALFPEFQRMGLDGPEKMNSYLALVLKFLFRYGIFLAAFSMAGIFFAIAFIFPKYQSAFTLVLWFTPGIWAFWMFNFANNGLLGLRLHRLAVFSHLISLGVYLLALFTLPRLIGMPGLALAYDLFCLSLFVVTYVGLRAQIGWKNFRIWQAMTAEENDLLKQVWGRIKEKFQ